MLSFRVTSRKDKTDYQQEFQFEGIIDYLAQRLQKRGDHYQC